MMAIKNYKFFCNQLQIDYCASVTSHTYFLFSIQLFFKGIFKSEKKLIIFEMVKMRLAKC